MISLRCLDKEKYIVTEDWKRIIQYVNKKYNVQSLLKKFHGLNVCPGDTFKCPYHDDVKNSAQLFPDNKFYCYACVTQYTPYLIFKNNGFTIKNLADKVPDGFSYEKENVDFDDGFYQSVAFSFRNEYQKTNDLRKLIDNWNTVIDYKEGIKNGK